MGLISPFFGNAGSFIQMILGSIAQQRANDAALADNRKRYGQSTDINLGQLGSGNTLGNIGWAARDAGIDLPALRENNKRTLAEYDALRASGGMEDRLRGTNAGLLGDYEAGASAIQKGFDERLFRNMARVDQIGDQERKDINRSYDEETGRSVQDAAARGLGGSTVAQGLRSNVNMQRGDALGRLNDRILANKINTDSALSGDQANAAMGLFQGRQGLLGNNATNELNLDKELTMGRTNLRDSQFKDEFNFGNQALGNINATISGATDSYPSQANFINLMQGLGQNMGYNNYLNSRPSGLSALFSGIGGGAAGGVTGGLTGGLIGGLFK